MRWEVLDFMEKGNPVQRLACVVILSLFCSPYQDRYDAVLRSGKSARKKILSCCPLQLVMIRGVMGNVGGPQKATVKKAEAFTGKHQEIAGPSQPTASKADADTRQVGSSLNNLI